MSRIAEIFKRVQCSPAESLVLQVIADRANVMGQNCRISYEALAAATGFSVRYVIQLVKRLEGKCLLRVQRAWIGLRRCAINCYDIVRPWLRELNYRQAYAAQRSRQTPERLDSEQSVHRETKNINKEAVSHDLAIQIGLTPGSFAYNASRGLPDDKRTSNL